MYGIACMNFPASLNAQTIHRWSGLIDGRYKSADIVNLITTSPKFEKTLFTIKNTDVLIIDEISMISQKVFDQIVEICSIRDSDKLFGGIQVILCGDFYQLPPVRNSLYGDDGKMCFTSEIFENGFPHRIVLKDVVRQNEDMLIEAIRDVTCGEVRASTIDFLKSLERPLEHDNSIKLFANNFLVDLYNRKKIIECHGDIKEYVSKDSRIKRMLISRVLASSKLWLKENCPVILLKNISQKLVNGLQGVVVGFEADGPLVHFKSINVTTKIGNSTFSVFDPKLNQVVATREQIPLKLAYGLTIHKSQGMTLESVEIDCQEIFVPGQLGVGLSRAKRVGGLRVVNFNSKVCLPHPDVLDAFMKDASTSCKDDFPCCRNYKLAREEPDVSDDFIISDEEEADLDGFVDEEEFDVGFDAVIASLNFGESSCNFQLPENFKIDQILKDLIFPSACTDTQRTVNDILRILSGDSSGVVDFCRKQFVALNALIDKMEITDPRPVKPEHITEFYKQCNSYQTGDDYKLACLVLFNSFKTFSAEHSHICFKLTVEVRKFILQEKIKNYPVCSTAVSERQPTYSSRARIRYVGGYCISKLRNKYLKKLRMSLFASALKDIEELDDANSKLKYLNGMKEEEEMLKKQTRYQNTLIDVTRKQNIARGLTHITDELFEFFIHLCEKSLELLIGTNVHTYGEDIYRYCFGSISNSSEVLQKFLSVANHYRQSIVDISSKEAVSSQSIVQCITNELVSDVVVINCLFEEIVESFLLVMLNQFRKDILQSFAVSKTLAHRKQILTKKQKKESSEVKSVTFQSIENDTSNNRQMSHSLMHGLLLGKADIFGSMTKKQLFILCKAYGVKFQVKNTKAQLIEKLTNVVLNCDGMVDTSVFKE